MDRAEQQQMSIRITQQLFQEVIVVPEQHRLPLHRFLHKDQRHIGSAWEVTVVIMNIVQPIEANPDPAEVPMVEPIRIPDPLLPSIVL